MVDAIHLEQLREHGGLRGLRDDSALESALARPQHRWRYDPDVDVPGLAAAYAFGLTRDHPYRDGNKRTAFVAMVTFLGLNGWDFDAPETDVVTEIVRLAAGQVSEDQLAAWIRTHSVKRRK